MNILITGCNGQLGREMQALSRAMEAHTCFYTDVDELDICKLDLIENFVQNKQINCIVNCAAYTSVDKAETDLAKAYLLNEFAVENLAKVAAKYNAYLIHISTDYVFSGEGFLPWTEENKTCPVGVYGKSKLAGEDAVRKYANKAIIIRTSWLYSAFGNNFVKTMLRLGKEKTELSVVFDQVGTPTYAKDLARTILCIIGQLQA
ncbi:MAG: dTDP-4-dehydrorhamnose reductase, partial [Bacteroidales bacterium]